MFIYENKLTGEIKRAILHNKNIYNPKDKEYYNIIEIKGERKRLITVEQFNELFRKMTKEEVKNELWKSIE